MKDGKFETQKEIYEALLDGKKIKREDFLQFEFVVLQKGLLLNQQGFVRGYTFSPPDHWSIYEEPKKKVKLYQFAYKIDNSWKITFGFYKNEQEVKDRFEFKNIIRLDHTMIEAEED